MRRTRRRCRASARTLRWSHGVCQGRRIQQDHRLQVPWTAKSRPALPGGSSEPAPCEEDSRGTVPALHMPRGRNPTP
ncbi:hypothetical protein NDU88_004016 [Pleurodeles waltl]|uniref:Uncharacterized protein n=1 Tax=Pleurodeles waltl TaxID=8319 RepID=A0AAV7LN54_PLEWA|nr:hypothetical protein NDU88_004016 [Pleurodeles waltl]